MKPDWENFGKAIMKAWPIGDIDGGELQELAERHGILRKEAYDPVKHGEHSIEVWDVEPGDPWYVPNYEEEHERDRYDHGERLQRNKPSWKQREIVEHDKHMETDNE